MTFEQIEEADSKENLPVAERFSKEAFSAPVVAGDVIKDMTASDKEKFGDLQLCSADPVEKLAVSFWRLNVGETNLQVQRNSVQDRL